MPIGNTWQPKESYWPITLLLPILHNQITGPRVSRRSFSGSQLLVAGDWFGRNTDDDVDLDELNLADLMEDKGVSW